jgi:peptide/nickel transport system substrate-binding protein
MTQVRGGCRPGRIGPVTLAIAIAGVAGACRDRQASTGDAGSTTLRIGLGQTSAINPVIGLRQLSQLLSFEGLARAGEDGRMLPSLAESWTPGRDGRSITVKLRPNVRFHDGSPVDAAALASILPRALESFMGLKVSIVESVTAGPNTVNVTYREKTPFLVESLEAPIQKQNGVSTGVFKADPTARTDLVANDDYYLGAPTLKRIHVEAFPSIRTAWAEMLRGRIDMLYEVGADALASMQNSSTVALFTVNRRYQYAIVLNARAPALRSREVRRALNLMVNRPEIVRIALDGYGIPSVGPIWPKHWALASDLPAFEFDPEHAVKFLKGLRFTCLVPPDGPTERVALEVKRQLTAAGIDLVPEQVPFDVLAERAGKGQYDALLVEVISGPTLFRPYVLWHSQGSFNYGKFGTSTSDAALDRVRHAQSDPEYREAIGALQQNFRDDPPAIFLAWSVRARAVSKRFTVPDAESGRDVLSNLRLWKPATGDLRASRN